MEEKKYNFGSPEVQKFLGLSSNVTDPSIRQNYIKNLANRLGLADIPGDYENEFFKQGISPEDLKVIDKYVGFDIDWKSASSVDTINRLTELAQSNPSDVYSYSTKESPLYRGTKVNPATIPGIGEAFSFDRFKSFTPDIHIAAPFTKGRKPFDIKDPNSFRETNPNTAKTLFQIQQEPNDRFRYLITPGAGEPEVLSRPSAKYIIEDKLTLPFNQREMGGDVNLVKLRQIYGIDPLGAGVQGGINLLKENIPGAVIGTAFSALNPEVAKDVAKNNYQQAAETVGKDIALGAVTEAGLRMAGKYTPVLNTIIAPAARVVAPVAAGAALFTQGRPGSLTDVITRKAASRPVSWLPAVKANPKTDLGARASRAISNEASYAFQQLLKGKIPYIGK
jgi:hypothetical protein